MEIAELESKLSSFMFKIYNQMNDADKLKFLKEQNPDFPETVSSFHPSKVTKVLCRKV
jgi:hypothetical protein